MSSSRLLPSLAVIVALVSPTVALGSDEWKGFTPAPLPLPAPSPAQPAAAAEPAVPSPPPVADQGAASDENAPPSESAQTTVKESVLPGSGPHSPSTWGNSLDSPSNLRVTSGAVGATGLHRISSADLGPAGTLRLGLIGEYFSKSDFPVLNARNVRSAGTLTIDYTFHRFFEAYLSYGAAANTNTRASPRLMQVQGDVAFGAKTGAELFKGFHGGIDLRLNVFPGVGSQDVGGYAFGIQPRLLASYDVRAVAPKVPLRAHLNVGGAFDGTSDIAGSARLSAAEEFALGANRFNRVLLGAGIEAPLPVVTPFVEYGFGYPIGADGLLGPDNNPVTVGSSMPQQLTLGAKVTALRDVSFLAAVDLGLTSRVAKGIPATMPYNVLFGISYNIDPGGSGESRLVEKTSVVEKKVEVAVAPPVYTGKVGGVVVDATTLQPLPGVIISMPGTGMPPVASDTEGGRFITHELPSGKVQLTAAREGYKPAAVEAVIEAGKVVAAQIALEREERLAQVKVTLTSGKKKVAGNVSFRGPKETKLSTEQNGTGMVELPAGTYTVDIDAEGYLARTRELTVPPTGELLVDVELSPQPKRKLVVVQKDKIQIKQQVHFATGKSTILADSHQLLDQVVDAIVRSNVKKIRIEGHTDNRGGKARNLKLSRERAQAVMDYLVKQGISPSRLEAEGYGDSRPVAPNLTRRGRELNRRVEFVIVER